MRPFASVNDYVIVYETDVSDERLLAMLKSASRELAAELRAANIPYDDPDDELAADLSDVTIAMVHRALGDPEGDGGPQIPFGASQFSQGAGGYTRSATLANPYGDLFVTEAERRRLGIGLAKASVLSPY